LPLDKPTGKNFTPLCIKQPPLPCHRAITEFANVAAAIGGREDALPSHSSAPEVAAICAIGGAQHTHPVKAP